MPASTLRKCELEISLTKVTPATEEPITVALAYIQVGIRILKLQIVRFVGHQASEYKKTQVRFIGDSLSVLADGALTASHQSLSRTHFEVRSILMCRRSQLGV